MARTIRVQAIRAPAYRLVVAATAFCLAAVIGKFPAGAADHLAYLEGIRGTAAPYLAPSELDPRFTVALYVNVATRGPNRQRMWVLERSEVGGPWRLALWDQAYWKRKAAKQRVAAAEPGYSWPISSGRAYPGDRRAGPTPPGVYGIDERKGRHGYGWMQDGMINVLHLDYHYSDGRMTGIAFHGTTPGRYGRLGTNDSHGCIRMHQTNARAVLDRLTGRDKKLADDMRWGEVPRFWRAERGWRRSGYVRDGSYLADLPPVAENTIAVDAAPDALPRPVLVGAPDVTGKVEADAPPAATHRLTKTGFRAVAVIFEE